jgi:MSHA biogenesis protein MshN
LSVINKMLQDLDRRQGAGGPQAGVQALRPVAPSARSGHEWFWRVLAVLVLAALCWVAWVAYQLQPRALATAVALHAAEKRPAVTGKVVARPTPVVEAPRLEPIAVPEPVNVAATADTPLPIVKAKKPKPAAPPAVSAAAPPEPKIVLDKRDRPKGAGDVAEGHFRRAATLLNQARISEAEEQLAAALKADASHVPARQAYVALLLEQQRVSSALRLLREGVETNPTQAVFALGLARVYAEQREYPAALGVIDKAGAAANAAEFQVLRGAILQRLARHDEAVSAYEAALRSSPQQPAGTWTGLAISLEALGRREDALQAYRRALGAAALTGELRDYAESRIRALR